MNSKVNVVFPNGETNSISTSETILEGLERAGREVEFNCREGFCGACSTKLVSGKVEYPSSPIAFIKSGTVLTCCAVAKTDIELG